MIPDSILVGAAVLIVETATGLLGLSIFHHLVVLQEKQFQNWIKSDEYAKIEAEITKLLQGPIIGMRVIP